MLKKAALIILISISFNSYSQNQLEGNLNDSEKANLINELTKLSKKEIDSSQTIVINFFNKPETKASSCIDNYSKDKSYLMFIKKNKNLAQFFITEKNFKYKKNKVIQDKNNIIKDLIFNDAKSCGNYIIIKNNGAYIKKTGEYRQDQIPELIEKM